MGTVKPMIRYVWYREMKNRLKKNRVI